MKRLLWISMHLADRIGWSGLLSIPVFAFASLFYIAALLPLQSEMQALAHQQPVGDTSSTVSPVQVSVSEPEKASALNEHLEDYLKQIYESGINAGLPIKRMDYRMVAEAGGGSLQYQISMPLTHSYPGIRTFIADVLHRVPVLSLDQVQLSRKRIADPVVEAELRFTLFLPVRP
ncbi:MAG: hypothetical protein ACK59Y_12630 [Betaproteobacteria bacterium]|jgi:uncharacterized iron-regulated membrane protein